MFISWLVFPLVAVLVCTGLGLLAERLAGHELPTALLLPLGIAALIAIAQITTTWSTTAPLTVGVVCAFAVVGLALRARGLSDRTGGLGPAALATVGVFLISGAPVIATGTPTFAGYTVLGDTAAHLTGAVELLDRGRDADGLPPSNYTSNFRDYYDTNAYPTGGPAALGTLARLVSTDPAWVIQPLLSLLIGTLALAIYSLLEPIVPSQRWAAFGGFLAAQPAILTAFAMQGAIKEIALAAMLATLAATLRPLTDPHARPRVAVLPGLAAAAALAALGPAAAIWIVPLVLSIVAIARVRGGSGRMLGASFAVLVGVAAVVSLQTLENIRSAASAATSVASVGEVGNLLSPLRVDQALGVWLTGDFRVVPVGAAMVATRLAEIAVVLTAAVGIAWCVRRRAWLVLSYAATLMVGAAFVILRGSPWIDAKGLAICASGIMVLSVLGVVALAGRWAPIGAVAGVVLTLGVLASSAFIYRSASLAPYDRLRQLADLADRVDNDGATLFTDFDEFGSYLLRDARPEPGPLIVTSPGDAGPLRGAASDLDGLGAQDIDRYENLVTRRGPVGSRPSSAYRPIVTTDEYVLWHRRADRPKVLARLVVGTPRAPVAAPECASLEAIARTAGATGLAYLERRPSVVVNPAREATPAGWRLDADDPALTVTSGAGTARAAVTVREPGSYTVWMEGSFGRPVGVSINGRRVGVAADALNARREAMRFGTVALASGRHDVEVQRLDAGIGPGSGGLFRFVGPVYLTPTVPDRLRTIPVARWRTLCGKDVDWIEAVG